MHPQEHKVHENPLHFRMLPQRQTHIRQHGLYLSNRHRLSETRLMRRQAVLELRAARVQAEQVDQRIAPCLGR